MSRRPILQKTVRFESPIVAGDGQGGKVTGGWLPEFKQRGEYTRIMGGEVIMSNRLEGKKTTDIKLRRNANTERITTDWRMVDDRTDEIFNIRTKIEIRNRRYFHITAESGVRT